MVRVLLARALLGVQIVVQKRGQQPRRVGMPIGFLLPDPTEAPFGSTRDRTFGALLCTPIRGDASSLPVAFSGADIVDRGLGGSVL